jgi:hypothetical protein
MARREFLSLLAMSVGSTFSAALVALSIRRAPLPTSFSAALLRVVPMRDSSSRMAAGRCHT